MSHAVAVLVTAIVCAVWMAGLETELRKDYAKAGYIVIDTKAYRLVPVEP